MNIGLTILDDIPAQANIDTSGMAAIIRDLPQQCEAAYAEASDLVLPPSYRDLNKIVIAGMGGSAIAGDYLRALLADQASLPVYSHRHYGLPPYLDEQTLFIASSYSGNTEETLSAFAAARATKAKMVVLTTGGKLLEDANAAGVPAFVIRYDAPPRAALGYSLMPLIAIAEKARALPPAGADIAQALAAMAEQSAALTEDVATGANRAKQVATQLSGRLCVVYGSGFLVPVARRWRSQLNENAKVWAFHDELPEANHNAIVGYGLPRDARIHVLFLQPAGAAPELRARYEFTAQVLSEAGISSETLTAGPGSTLTQMLTLTLLGDYVSYYLALLNGVDPTPVQAIDRLKAHLGNRRGSRIGPSA